MSELHVCECYEQHYWLGNHELTLLESWNHQGEVSRRIDQNEQLLSNVRSDMLLHYKYISIKPLSEVNTLITKYWLFSIK